jgi:hypothetical protein
MPANKRKTRSSWQKQLSIGKKQLAKEMLEPSVKKLSFLTEQKQQPWAAALASHISSVYLYSSFIMH